MGKTEYTEKLSFHSLHSRRNVPTDEFNTHKLWEVSYTLVNVPHWVERYTLENITHCGEWQILLEMLHFYSVGNKMSHSVRNVTSFWQNDPLCEMSHIVQNFTNSGKCHILW